MSGDIVERLRLLAATYPLWGEVKTRSTAAADQIEWLRAEVERLQRWKANAVTLLKQWNQIADDVISQLDADDTLSLRLPDIVASELERLRVERDASRAEVERLRRRLQACQSNDDYPLTDDCITQNERSLLAEVERLRAERKAIEAIHQPMGKPAACCTCWKSWPCRTHLLLHPEDGRRER